MKYLIAKLAKDKIDEKTGEVLDTFWTKIGAAFPHKQGGGFSVVLDALPPDGRFQLMEPLPEDERGERGGGRGGRRGESRGGRGGSRDDDGDRDDDRGSSRSDDRKSRQRPRR